MTPDFMANFFSLAYSHKEKLPLKRQSSVGFLFGWERVKIQAFDPKRANYIFSCLIASKIFSFLILLAEYIIVESTNANTPTTEIIMLFQGIKKSLNSIIFAIALDIKNITTNETGSAYINDFNPKNKLSKNSILLNPPRCQPHTS